MSASLFANYDASLQSLTGRAITWEAIRALDAWTLAKGALLGGAIPLMVFLVIESLRELATEGRTGTSSTGVDEVDEVADIAPLSIHSPVTPLPEARNGFHSPVVTTMTPRVDSSKPPRATPEAMRQLLVQEPTITATDVAQRLKIGRATVYLWRDSIGARRDTEGWVLP